MTWRPIHDFRSISVNYSFTASVSEAILFCSRQGIALRGDNEVLNGESCGNTGNFLAALQLTANHDDICMGEERLSSPAPMHIHCQIKIDLDDVVNLFATKDPGGWSSGQS